MPRPTPRLLVPLALSALVAVAGTTGAARQDGALERVPLAEGLTLLVGGGGNTVVSVGAQGALVVDTKLAVAGEALGAALAELAADAPLFVVNTHWHGDHTGNNDDYGAHATVLAHDNVRRRLAGDAALGGRVAKDTPAVALPDVTYEAGARLHFNGLDLRLQHFPNAHTDGDTVVWFENANVVQVADLYFEVGYPFVDVDSGGNVLGVIDGVRAVLAALPEGAKVVPGHGKLSDAEGLREYLEMLETSVDRVRALLAAGKTADEVVAAKPTADLDARWGGFDFVPPERYVRSVVASLQR